MKSKKSGGIFIWIFAAVALFLAVPFLFQEETNGKRGGKMSIDGEGLLPVVSSENPLTKYIKRLADFYGFKKKDSGRKSFAKNDVYSDDELMYMEEGFGAMFAAQNKSDSEAKPAKGGQEVSAEQIASIRAAYSKAAEVSLKDGTVRTESGLTIKPSQDGYSIEGKFYKNGTYPSLKNRREIERALSKFHKEKAAQEGLTAAYVRNSDGSLSVKYISPNMLDSKSRSLYASGKRDIGDDYYRGARILSRNVSSGESSSSGSERRGYLSSGSIDSAYDSISERLKEHFDEDDSQGASSEREEEREESRNDKEENLSQELIANSNRAPVSLLITSQLREAPNKIPDSKYLDAPRVALKLPNTNANIRSLNDLLAKYGITNTLSFEEMQLPNIAPGTSREQIREIMSEWGKHLQAFKSEDGLLRVFSPTMIPDTVFTGGNNDPYMYVGYPRVPYMDVDGSGQPAIISFSEVFLNRTGLANMFDAMRDSEGERLDTSELEDRYLALDSMRNENNKYLQMLGQNDAISNKMPKVVFYLGKLRRSEGNVAVASPSSFLYVYAPNMAPDFVVDGGTDSSYREMSAAAFLDNVNKRGSNNIVIVNDERLKETLKKAGVKNVSVIETDRLSSGTPEDVEYVIGALKEVVAQRVMSDEELKQEFIKAMTDASKKEKGGK